jgi:hypothetical protein
LVAVQIVTGFDRYRDELEVHCYGCSSLGTPTISCKRCPGRRRLLAEADRTVAELGRRVGYGRPQHAPCSTLDFRHLCLI